MTQEQVHNAIRSRFKTLVATVQSLTTVYDNDPTPAPSTNTTWCRFTILPGTGRRITIGSYEYRYPGVAVAQLFGPIHRGDKALLALADAIITAFRSVHVTGIRFESDDGDAVSPVRVGVSEGVYQVNVTIPFVAAVAA